ncbi:uncharacterized protein LOC133803228 [Humulus lupulus]|uniref:uncharacterized protein LOC133803228 n=1 Tax=Humulus lupulus TaxID=3486 RepID=UPI002B402215|nr:uncharacterized protein LOC133803228 [Humulus lupulus]
MSSSREDFSFPTENFPSCMDSPPLWHLSPATSATQDDEDEEISASTSVAPEKLAILKNVHDEKVVKRDHEEQDEDEDEDERMDLLWENFNEELSRSSSSRTVDAEKIKAVGCAHQPLKVSRRSTTDNKPPVVMVLKVLKKLFLLHHPHPHPHPHPRHHKRSRAW